MSVLEMNYMSRALIRKVSVSVILPFDVYDQEAEYVFRPPFPTLYLLNGYTGNHLDFITETRISRFAKEHGLAVLMPDGDNSFYLNHGNGENFARFISEDLIEASRRIFPLSEKREETFIGGVSMGAYGALINGLRHPELFGAIVSLSAPYLNDPVFPEADLPSYWMKKNTADNTFKPNLYLACGSKDPLFDSNISFQKAAQSLGYSVTWHQKPLGHQWRFWDEELEEAVNWLLPKSEKAIDQEFEPWPWMNRGMDNPWQMIPEAEDNPSLNTEPPFDELKTV